MVPMSWFAIFAAEEGLVLFELPTHVAYAFGPESLALCETAGRRVSIIQITASIPIYVLGIWTLHWYTESI